jgi:hypothetical protein
MKSETVNNISMNDSLGSTTGDSTSGRTQRVIDRLGIDPRNNASACAEESMVVDDRCKLSPAQMVETKLTRVLGGSTLPVSHLQTRKMLKDR